VRARAIAGNVLNSSAVIFVPRTVKESMASYRSKGSAYQVPTSAWAPGMCADTAGRPYYDPERQMCVDAEGRSGYSPPPAVPMQTMQPGATLLSDVRPHHDAARNCTPWVAYGIPFEPLLGPSVLGPGVVPGPVNEKTCDPYWGISVKGNPSKGACGPEVLGLYEWRDRYTNGDQWENMRCLNPYKTDRNDPLRGTMGYVSPKWAKGKEPLYPNSVRRYRASSGNHAGTPALLGILSLVVLVLVVCGGASKK
jgi:hypothetical protein